MKTSCRSSHTVIYAQLLSLRHNFQLAVLFSQSRQVSHLNEKRQLDVLFVYKTQFKFRAFLGLTWTSNFSSPGPDSDQN